MKTMESEISRRYAGLESGLLDVEYAYHSYRR